MRKIFTLLLLILLFPITTLAENQTVYVGSVELTGSTDSPAYAMTDKSGNVTQRAQLLTTTTSSGTVAS